MALFMDCHAEGVSVSVIPLLALAFEEFLKKNSKISTDTCSHTSIVERERERERQTERETERETERDRKTDRQTARQTDRQSRRETDRWTEMFELFLK